jgi:hypothetical protein
MAVARATFLVETSTVEGLKTYLPGELKDRDWLD